MKQVFLTAVLCVPMILAGCEDQNTYPISGEECGPDDAVKTLDTGDCAPPVAY
ncbi:MAG: hypothetical protein QNI90_02055 [Dinoroseobacter sp.]|nr:hypothetical protein [Dinoroseobacter sp.]